MKNPYQCQHCFKAFKSTESRHHHLARYHGYEPIVYKCTHCDETFKYKDTYMLHLTEVHEQTSMRFECGQCTSSFKRAHHLQYHVKIVHDPNKPIYKCPECDKTFERRDSYSQHMRYVHAQTFTLHRCELCSKIYRSKATLKMHIDMNHNENFKRSSCPLCPANFKWPQHLKQHIGRVHIQLTTNNDRSRNKCTLCHTSFDEKLDLLMHVRNDHNLDLDIYKCCQCKAVFTLKEPIRRHLEKHEDEKGDHKCEQCHPVIKPKMYARKEQAPASVPTKIEDEIIDFEVSIMEDDDLREMIRYKMRHYLTNDTFDKGRYESDESMDFSHPIVQLVVEEPSASNETELKSVTAMEASFEQDEMVKLNCSLDEINAMELSSEQTHHFQQNDEESLVDVFVQFSSDGEADNGAEITSSNNEFNKEIKISDVSVATQSQIVENKREEAVVEESSNQNIAIPRRMDKELVVQLRKCDPVELQAKGTQNSIKQNAEIAKKTDAKLKCKHCDMTFTKSFDIARHVRLDHKKKSPNVVKKTKETSPTREQPSVREPSADRVQNESLDTTQTSAPDENSTDKIPHSPTTDLASPVSIQVFECGKCALSFDSKLQLLRHISSTHMNIKHIKSLRLSKHSDTHSKFSCHNCNREFSTKKHLIKHVKTHAPISYECNACAETFPSINERNRHLRARHRQKCGICGIHFVHKEKLIAHMRSRHDSRPKEHKCNVCNSIFRLAASLAKHIDVNHGKESVDVRDSMHKCDTCGALFPLLEALQRHVQLEHDVGSLHKCGVCTAVFNDIDEFKEHFQIEHIR